MNKAKRYSQPTHPATAHETNLNKTERTKRLLEITIRDQFEDINLAALLQIQQELGQKLSDIQLNLIDTNPGSIQLIFEGSEEDLERLQGLFQSGELTEISGRTIENVKFIDSENREQELRNKLNAQNKLIQEIRSQNVEGRNLEKTNFKLGHLKGIFLRQAYLNGSDLRVCDLSGSDLSGSDLSGSDLSGSDLTEAYLYHANLSGADLIRANLSGANLTGAYFYRANLSDANLRNSELSGADLIRANLSGANLTGANLTGTYLYHANLTGADLNNSNLYRADLRDAALTAAEVNNIHLGNNLGISESLKRDLIARGAIFEDSPPGTQELISFTS